MYSVLAAKNLLNFLVLFLIKGVGVIVWTLHSLDACLPPWLMVWCDACMHDDDVFLCFYTRVPFALFRPRTGLAEPPFSSQRGQRRGGGWDQLLLSYLSLNKSLWWRQQAFSLCSLSLSCSLLLSVALLCLSVWVFVEHCSTNSFHISCSSFSSSSLLHMQSCLCACDREPVSLFVLLWIAQACFCTGVSVCCACVWEYTVG